MPDWVTCPSPGSGAIMSPSPPVGKLVFAQLFVPEVHTHTHTHIYARAQRRTCTRHRRRERRRAGRTDTADSCPRALRPKVFFSPVVVCIIALGFISNQRWTEHGWWTPPLDCLPEFTRFAHDSSARCNPPCLQQAASRRLASFCIVRNVGNSAASFRPSRSKEDVTLGETLNFDR